MKKSKLFVYLAILVLLFSFSLVSTSCGGGNNGGGTPPPPKPTVSLTASASSISLGASVTLNWSSTNATSCAASGDWSGAKPTSGSESVTPATTGSKTYTLSCSGAGGSASASVSVSVTGNPVPKIVSVGMDAIFCPRECAVSVIIEVQNVSVDMTTFTSNHGNLLSLQLIDPTHMQIMFNFDTPHYNPGFFEIWATNPPPGGGDSNHARLAFLGNLNTLALSETEAFQLGQGSGTVYKFRLGDGATDGQFGGGLIYGISVDDKTGYVIMTNRDQIFWGDQNGNGLGSSNNEDSPLAVSAKGGYACASQDMAGKVVSSELLQGTQPLIPVAVGNTPWDVAMAKLGDQLACAVYNAGDGQFSLVKIPETVLWRSSTLNGLTPFDQILGGQGGWQLSVSDSGPAQGTAALLAQYDKAVVFVDLNTALETRRVALDGVPFRIAVDNVHGTVIVALADVSAGLTRFVKVDIVTGAVTPLNSTVDFLATGFGVSADGSSLYVANRDQFRILPNE